MTRQKIYTDIPGMPQGWGLKALRLPEVGEWILGPEGPEEVDSSHMSAWPVAILTDARKWSASYPDTHTLLPLRGLFRSGREDEWVEGVCVEYNRFTTHKWKSDDGMWYKRFMMLLSEYEEKKAAK